MNKFYRKIIEGKLFESIANKVYKFIMKAFTRLHSYLLRLYRMADRILSFFPRKQLYQKYQINPKQIMFLTYQGSYTCNPKAISEEIIRQKLPYRLVWVVKNDEEIDMFPPELNLVKRGSYEFYVEAAKTKLFVDNTHNLLRLGIRKKSGQILLQTWHGSLGIKRLDGNIVMNRNWEKLAEQCQKDTDYCISNSSFENEVYQTSYWKNVPVLEYGHSRNDILYCSNQEKEEIKKKVYQSLHIAEDKKLLLYAPTHRDNVGELLFELDYAALLQSLEERFGGQWIIAIRLHARMKKNAKKWIDEYSDKVVNATFYSDMQELMIAADVGVTDYSSWIFDYLLMGKPGFILANDLEDFEKSRDFYYPLPETPFSICEDNLTLVQAIASFDEEDYTVKVKKFLSERGCIEDGKASQRIVAKIREFLK